MKKSESFKNDSRVFFIDISDVESVNEFPKILIRIENLDRSVWRICDPFQLKFVVKSTSEDENGSSGRSDDSRTFPRKV